MIIKDIINELHFLSDRISTQVRVVALGLIVLTWGLLIGGTGKAFINGYFVKKLLIVGMLALVALFSDYLQYFFGYLNTDTLRKKMEEENLEQGDYECSDWLYRLRKFFFWVKQGFLWIAIVYLLVILIPYLFCGD